MRKGTEQSLIEKIIFIAAYILADIAAVCIVTSIVKRDPASAVTAVSAVACVLATSLFVGAVALIHNARTIKFKELKNAERVMQQLNSMVVLWDTSFGYIRANDAFIRTTGYTEEELYDPEILKKVLPSDAFSENLQGIINSRDEEFFIQTKTNGAVCTVWNTSVVTTISGRINNITVMMSIGPNLTEANKMKQEVIAASRKLQESEKRYALSMDLSEIGLLLKEKGSSRLYASDQLCEMLGIASASGYVESDIIREAFHPKDRVIFDTFASGMKNDSEDLAHDEIHSVDFRAKSADGDYHWFNFRYQSPKTGDLDVGGAIMDITSDKEKDLVIERMAYIDEVTQLYNRNKFMMMGNEILECTRIDKNVNYWVIVLDIDSFHIINDTCGYTNGNHLLKEIAAVLLSNLTEGGFTARIGGDNFALLIKATEDEELPIRLIKHIQLDMANINGMGLEAQNITCSAGYCLMSDGGLGDFSQVLDRAEFALSLSDGTRSSILRFDNHAHDAIIAGNAIEKELGKAIENNELVLYYQPKINLLDGSVMGMEALIRWIRPDGTVVPPSDFIPVAERSMLITQISRFVLFEACRQNKSWQDMGLDPVTVSINLSAIDFYQTNVTDTIQTALKESGLDPQYLDVELTESLALKDIDHAVMQMQEIKDLGVKLSMDDFGTGYSSLSYIQMLPITLLKLDRSFIMYLEEDEISREIVSAVIRIAKSKKIETIAEGIETVGQGEILKKSGCDYAQGYFFGKPMPADRFEEFLRSRQTKAVKV
ncbi:MAG: EAL domain-containing protein [Oscillospiraceae bacterium]|nr:EAL domain-containing protein [Oscillospiraceae bacterium]